MSAIPASLLPVRFHLSLKDEPVEKLWEPFTKEQLHALVKQALDMFPEFVHSVRHLTDVDPSHRKIFVHGLGWDATAETLTSVFGKYGEIEDCKAGSGEVSGKSKGYAFILSKHREGARKSLKNLTRAGLRGGGKRVWRRWEEGRRN